MRKIITLVCFVLLCGSAVKAQYVSLPDSNFRNYLSWIYPGCFNGAGQLDTTCSEIVNEDSLSLSFYFNTGSPINMSGLRFFKSLIYLDFSGASSNHKELPELPPVLKELKCQGNTFTSFPPFLPSTLQFIYSKNSSLMSAGFTQLPSSLLHLDCSGAGVDSLPDLPNSLKLLDVSDCYGLRSIPNAAATSLEYLNCSNSGVSPLPLLPNTLKKLFCNSIYSLDSLPPLPASLDTLICSDCHIATLPALPPNLTYLDCSRNIIKRFPELPRSLLYFNCGGRGLMNPYDYDDTSTVILPALPPNLKYLNCNNKGVTVLPTLPIGLVEILCYDNRLTQLPPIPSSLTVIDFALNRIRNFPMLPATLRSLSCAQNPLYTIPSLPDSLKSLSCYSDSLSSLPALPPTLIGLYCVSNQLAGLPILPATLKSLGCASNYITSLPPLPPGIENVDCAANMLTSLPDLPNSLREVRCTNNDIHCLPLLPDPSNNPYPMFSIEIDANEVNCIPNRPPGVYLVTYDSMYMMSNPNLPLCNPTNNINHCKSFPVMQGIVFYDNNNNGIKDASEPTRTNVQVNLSNNRYSFSNNNGMYEIGADSIGGYNLTSTAPRYFTYSPASYNYNFATYDTLVTGNFALQATSVVNELTVHITPINWAARPGFSYPYMISYENTGTTTLSPTVVFDYDETRLMYNSSSVVGVVDNNSALTYNTGSLQPGQSSNFIGYFTVKTTTVIGDTLKADISMTAGSYETTASSTRVIGGSFDPNDKQATPQLSPSQVANGEYIDYTIRFQNTGTDTAFTVVISDTLSDDLQANTLQMIASSHNCKATVKDNVAFFEFINILLPDSNVNEPKSHGFVSFKIKPRTTVSVNTTITNKAAIYFDYNAPVITNTAGTLIKEFTVVPLKLISFSAVPQNDNTVLLYWNTANEINTKYFAIERSNDGLRFNSIASVFAKGKANNNYNTTVADANTTIVFYRLKIVDNDGTFSYSPVIKIDKRKNAAGFSILSNPVKDFIIISTTDRTLNNTQANILNMQGAVVKTFIVKEGSQTVEVKDLPAGIYYLRTINGSSRILLQ